jgi:hypothetical protein
MTKISNQYSLTNILTADLANSRLGINNVSPTVALDVTGAGKFSSSVTATIGNLSTIIGANSGTWISNSLKSDLGNNSTLPIINGKANSFYNAYTMIYNHIADGSASNFLGLGFYGLDNSFKLNANGAATFQSANAKTNTGNWNQTIYDTSTMAAGVGGGISFCGNKATSTLGLFAAIDGYKENATSANELGGFRIWTSNGTNLVERMRITSAGNVGIGVTSLVSPGGSRNLLQISNGTNGGQIALGSSTTESNNARIFSGQYDLGFAAGVTTGNVLFYTNDTERMRITSGGNVLINKTTASGYPLEVEVFSDGNLAYFTRQGANTKMFMGGTTAGATAFYIQSNTTNGVYLTAGGTSWTANSDIRLKNIISPIDSAVDKLTTLNPVIFSWKSDDTNKENIGLIAQDVKEVFPQVIDTNEDGFLGVRYVELVPVLVKAIQELSAKVSLLENK